MYLFFFFCIAFLFMSIDSLKCCLYFLSFHCSLLFSFLLQFDSSDCGALAYQPLHCSRVSSILFNYIHTCIHLFYFMFCFVMFFILFSFKIFVFVSVIVIVFVFLVIRLCLFVCFTTVTVIIVIQCLPFIVFKLYVLLFLLNVIRRGHMWLLMFYFVGDLEQM